VKRAFRFRRTCIAAAVGSAVASLTMGYGGLAYGSAFALQEQSGSGLGNAFAGGAASADDASTIFSNPAGMSRLPYIQGVIAGSLICLSAKFNNGSSQAAAGQPLGGDGGDAGSCSGVPAAYLSVPINNQWAFGIGINAPFGLKTNYDSGWIGRFQALESKVETLNVNPAVSFKVNDMVSLGVGADYQHLRATLGNNVNYAAAIGQGALTAAQMGLIPPSTVAPISLAYAGAESDASVSGNDSGWGWNVGILVNFDPQTRFGASYRSKVKYNVSGTADITNPPVPATLPPSLAPVAAAVANAVNDVLASGAISLAIEMPDTANVSIFKQLDTKWDVMADLQYTGWSTIQALTIVRSTGTVLSSTPENFRNTWRGSVGANYHYTDQWMFRGGLAYDQSPVRSATLTPRLPDNDRTWVSLGVQYKLSPQLSLDGGYTYLFVKDPDINQNAGSTLANGLINGAYKNSVNIFAAQLTYTFK
jgi:long-chain fatty acid transport protein